MYVLKYIQIVNIQINTNIFILLIHLNNITRAKCIYNCTLLLYFNFIFDHNNH